jgi:GT2 family glycosyltransferase
MKRERIVVLGFMSHFPVAGVAWQTMHYLIGFQRLGFDVFYVECHGCAPTKLMINDNDDGAMLAAAYIDAIMRRFDLHDHWAYQAVSESRCFGLSATQLRELLRSAAFILNLHGSHMPVPELTATGRLVFLETDPVDIEIDLHNGKPKTLDYLRPHCAFFTFGEAIGQDGCLVPPPQGFQFHPTRQPVVLDFWRDLCGSHGEVFTTIGNWRQPWREVQFQGETLRWSKHFEFEKFIDLPKRLPQPFELALSSSSCDENDRRMLAGKGWRVRDALEFSGDLDRYRSYIGESRGEFTVAKEQNVKLRSGWFSDRSATYLAAGRPVITQETAFGAILPVGEGLFAFASMDDIVAAVEAINSDYNRHRLVAQQIAHEYFSHEVVLTRLLSDLGMSKPGTKTASNCASAVLPPDAVVVPISRWPTRLPRDTMRSAFSLPIPVADTISPIDRKRASIVMVTYNSLAYTKMCLASLLGHGWYAGDELIIVDNNSADQTRDFLHEVQQRNPFVHLELNHSNRGFAAANNQGLARTSGDILILLNNDTIVMPGWRDALMRWLEQPGTGIVGPVTNRTCNEAQIDAPYRTYAELENFAIEHMRSQQGRASELPMLAMFCLAMRRQVFEKVGPLDEQFEVGMFEDDDYSRRVRQAGYKVVCAEDLFVHHFGQAAFGELCINDTYDAIYEANRKRFEEKWHIRWEPHKRRTTPEYERLRSAIKETVALQLPAGATVMVINKGDEELLKFSRCRGWHFPRAADGQYPNIYPADSADAIAQLEACRASGADFLVIPKSALWWLDYYSDFKTHLEQVYRLRVRDDNNCLIFDLGGGHA